MNTIRIRSATSCVLLASCLPLTAQETRFESRGEAYIAALEQADVEAAIARHVTGVAPADRAQVVFFRPATGVAHDVAVRESGSELAVLPSGSYFIVIVQPGTYTYTTDDAAGNALTLTVEPGRTYFAKAATTGSHGHGAKLRRSNAMAFIDAANGRHRSF